MDLRPGTAFERVFDRIICLEYYDGPVAGLAKAAHGVGAYRFDKVAWDELQDLRVFLFAPVPGTIFEEIVERLSLNEVPRWPMWVPRLERAVSDEATSRVPTDEPDIVITSDDALLTIKSVRHIHTHGDRQAVKDLLAARALVGQWQEYIHS